MRFEWDEAKAASNFRKHRVLFETAMLAFEDPHFLMIDSNEVDGEVRWQTIGMVEGALLLLVVHTLEDEDGEETVRIISAREVTSHERRIYEHGNEGK